MAVSVQVILTVLTILELKKKGFFLKKKYYGSFGSIKTILNEINSSLCFNLFSFQFSAIFFMARISLWQLWATAKL